MTATNPLLTCNFENGTICWVELEDAQGLILGPFVETIPIHHVGDAFPLLLTHRSCVLYPPSSLDIGNRHSPAPELG